MKNVTPMVLAIFWNICFLNEEKNFRRLTALLLMLMHLVVNSTLIQAMNMQAIMSNVHLNILGKQ
jgi:hypothetical protein